MRADQVCRAGLLRALAGPGRFSIVSNNCWGAHVYQALRIPYATPFVGLFIEPDSYLELLQDFDRLISAPLTFVRESRSAALNGWRTNEALAYPIGLLGRRIEINFQHYRNEAEAQTIWARRVLRMTAEPARRFFKFDDRQGAQPADLTTFLQLPLINRVCFAGRSGVQGAVVAPTEPGGNTVVDGLALARLSRRCFNTMRWISSRPKWIPLPSLI